MELELPKKGTQTIVIASTSKRKRSTSDDEDSSTEKGGEVYKTDSMLLNLDEGSSSRAEQTVPFQESDKSNKAVSRKRKFAFPGDNVPVKKNKKFYFISESMIKSRKTRIQKRVVVTQTVDDQEYELTGIRRQKLYFTKVNESGDAFLVHRSDLESDLFRIDEKRHSYELSKHKDLGFHIVDTVSLEGLDGITLEAFWKRLRNVYPNNFSKKICDTIWKSICANKHINFFILDKARDELNLRNKWKYVDMDSGTFIDPIKDYTEPYPFKLINQPTVRGSCSTFDSRIENNGVRKLSLLRASTNFGRKLVLVGNQTLRNKALFHEEADPLLEFTPLEYCILERVGRAREFGEMTHGKVSLQAIQSEPKKLFYNRKVLAQGGLIMNQAFFVKSISAPQNLNGGLVHLTRFFSKRASKQILIMDQLAQILRKRPDYSMDFLEFRRIFGRSLSMVKLIKTAAFRKYFKIHAFLYRQIYPGAPKSDWRIKSTQKERTVRTVKLTDPYINITAACDKDKVEKTVAPPNQIDESPGNKLINYECLRDVFLCIITSGREGLTVQEIHEHFKTDYYTIRMAVKKLLVKNVIASRRVDSGRQQSLKFYSLSFTNPNIEIRLKPKEYELDPYVMLNALKGYDNKLDESVKMYSAYEAKKSLAIVDEDEEMSPNFTLTFDTFFCNAYLTDLTDSSSEDVRIFDIINKGRDRLLLCASNLSVLYLPEWDNLVLKRPDFFKNMELFQSGFGKMVYEFLSSLKFSLTADNCIVFDMNHLISTGNRKCKLIPNYEHHITIERNYVNPHSDAFYFDLEAKVYLFQALFDPNHDGRKTIENLRLIVKEGVENLETFKRKPQQTVEKPKKPEVEVEDNIINEKFLGPHPILERTEKDSSGIITEVYISTVPGKFIKSGTPYTNNDPKVTQRFINRANIILNAIHRLKILKDTGELVKLIRIDEEQDGYDKVMCFKTGLSILSILVEEGYLKIIKVVLKRNNLTRSHVFICAPDQNLDHSFIKSTIEELKMKMYVGSPGMANRKTMNVRVTKEESPFSTSDVLHSISEFRAITRGSLPINFKRCQQAGRKYGFRPKFVRMRILHEFLYYVIHELPANQSTVHSWEVDKILENLDVTSADSIPPIYSKDISWKTFIHPLPIHKGWPKGWALACDLTLRLPLSIFVQIYNVTIYMKELEDFLKHPVKKHYLVKCLPDNIRTVLLHNRKYFAHIYEVFCNLCQLGLVQLGPRSYKIKDQIFVYLNKRASIYDTTTSGPGYHTVEDKPYVKRSFEFVSKADVDLYWSELWRICHNTPLGKRRVVDGEVVIIEDSAIKPDLIKSVQSRTSKEVEELDNGQIPGDLKGAGGLDSSLWSYLRRNWVWKSYSKTNPTVPASSLKKSNTGVKPILFGDLLKMKGAQDKKVYLNKPKKVKKVKPIKRTKSLKKMVIYRKIDLPKKTKRQHHDNLDRAIMKRNRTARIDWDDNENSIVRLSRLAALFLYSKSKKQFIPYNVMRDVLHRLYPKSKNKTAHAYKRRLHFLWENDDLLKIMESNVENLMNDPTIAKCLGQVHLRFKNNVKYLDSQVHVAFVYLVAYMVKNKQEIERLLLGYVATVDFFCDSYISLFELILEPTDRKSAAFSTVQTKEDVLKDTIKSILHVVLNQQRNNPEQAFRVYHTYKQFSDELIKETVFELKASQFLTLNRGYLHKTVNIWPLKFSLVYQNVKCSTFTHSMFSAAFSRLVTLIDGHFAREESGNFMAYNEIATFIKDFDLIFNIPEMEIILNTEIEDHSEVIEELAKRFLLYLKKIHESSNENDLQEKKELLKVLESKEKERTIDEVKNLAMCLIFRVPYLIEGELENHFKKIMESDSHLEINNYISLMIEALKDFAVLNADDKPLHVFVNNLTNQMDDQTELLENLSKVVFAIQLIHQVEAKTCSWDSRSVEERYKHWEQEELDMSSFTKLELPTKSVETVSSTRLFTKKNSSISECIEKARAGNFPTIEEIKEGMMTENNSEIRRIPHITDLTMLLTKERFPELDVDDETVERWKENFVVQYPQLEQFFISNVDRFVNDPITANLIKREDFSEKINGKLNKCIIIEKADMVKIREYLSHTDNYSKNLEFACSLINYIAERKHLGVSGPEIKEKFSSQTSLNLVDLMDFMCSVYIILRAGTTSIRFVHHDYQSHWLIDSFKLSPEDRSNMLQTESENADEMKTCLEKRIMPFNMEKIHLKPWTGLDGSFNKDICIDWMCVILSKCCDSPHITFSKLCNHFWNLKPVELFSLLELLQDLKCIEIYVYNNQEIALLSSRDIIADIGPATILDNFEDMYVKTTPYCGLSFGHIAVPFEGDLV